MVQEIDRMFDILTVRVSALLSGITLSWLGQRDFAAVLCYMIIKKNFLIKKSKKKKKRKMRETYRIV